MVEAGPVGNVLTPWIAHPDQEDFRLILLDSKCGILANGVIAKGGAKPLPPVSVTKLEVEKCPK